LIEHLLGDVLEHLGGDEAGRDRVDGDPDRVLLELARALQCEARLTGE
jgi:hypothetical protein